MQENMTTPEHPEVSDQDPRRVGSKTLWIAIGITALVLALIVALWGMQPASAQYGDPYGGSGQSTQPADPAAPPAEAPAAPPAEDPAATDPTVVITPDATPTPTPTPSPGVTPAPPAAAPGEIPTIAPPNPAEDPELIADEQNVELNEQGAATLEFRSGENVQRCLSAAGIVILQPVRNEDGGAEPTSVLPSNNTSCSVVVNVRDATGEPVASQTVRLTYVAIAKGMANAAVSAVADGTAADGSAESGDAAAGAGQSADPAAESSGSDSGSSESGSSSKDDDED